MTSESLQDFRQKWTDALAAFGAHIEIHELPASVETRESLTAFIDESEVEERPVRVVVAKPGRENVSGPVLVEIDECRSRIVQAFGETRQEVTT